MTAPSALTCRTTLPSGFGCAVEIKMSSTSPAERLGSADQISAAMPAVNGDEKLVPLFTRAAFAGALGSGPSHNVNGAKIGTCSTPKLESPAL